MTDAAPRAMAKGENVPLSILAAENLSYSVRLNSLFDDDAIDGPDVSALALGVDGRVRSNDDFVFYNQSNMSGGAIRIDGRDSPIGPEPPIRTDAIAVDLGKLDDEVDRVVVAASLDEQLSIDFTSATTLGVVLVDVTDGSELATFEVVPEGHERAVLFAEFYRRGGEWKFRTVGQGYAGGLASLAEDFGVELNSTESPESELLGDDDPAAVPDGGEPAGPAPGAAAVPSPGRVSVKRAQRPPTLPEWSISSSLLDDSEWERARLFSVSGIGTGGERERRAVSALLAVMGGVREFGRELTKRAGGPPGTVQTFIEPEFVMGESRFRPDGLVQIRRGQKQWTALIEAKTSNNALSLEQVERYVDIAKANGFDAVITISNQLLGGHEELPVPIDKRKLRRVALHHLSWDEIRSVAIQMSMHHRIEDSTQGWVLREFVRYQQHEQSKLHGFTDMGPLWAQVRDGVKNKTIHPKDKSAIDVCHQFDQLIRHVGHDLSCLLGVDVVPNFPRNRLDSTSRVQQLTDSGILFGSLRIPGATGPLTVSMDLRLERISCSTTVDAADNARPATRVRNLLRQIPDAPARTVVQSVVSGRQVGSARSVELGTLREDPAALSKDDDRPPKRFVITMSGPLGGKGGAARGNVVNATDGLITAFYRDVVQNLRQPRATPEQ